MEPKIWRVVVFCTYFHAARNLTNTVISCVLDIIKHSFF